MKGAKTRLLSGRLAEVLATLRHGELIFVADAGNNLSTLPPGVETLDLGVVTGVPSLEQILPALRDTGDIERAIVADQMRGVNLERRALVDEIFGAEHVREVPYLPDMYRLRDQAKLVVQTGEYTVDGNVVLVGGYPSADIKTFGEVEIY